MTQSPPQGPTSYHHHSGHREFGGDTHIQAVAVTEASPHRLAKQAQDTVMFPARSQMPLGLRVADRDALASSRPGRALRKVWGQLAENNAQFLVPAEECAGGGALSLDCRLSVMFMVHICHMDLSVCVTPPLTPERATVSLSCEGVFGVPRPLTMAVMAKYSGTGPGSRSRLAPRKGTGTPGGHVARGGRGGRACGANRCTLGRVPAMGPAERSLQGQGQRGQWGEGKWPQQEKLSEEATCRRHPHSVMGGVPGPRSLQEMSLLPAWRLSCLGWSPLWEPSLWVP